MKDLVNRALAPLLLFVLSGCATVKMARNFEGLRVDDGAKPIATVAIENYGYYLFGFLPLIAGEPRHPNAPMCTLFSDSVTTQNNIMMLNKTAQKVNAKRVVNINVYEGWTGSFSFWIIWKKQLSTGAVLTE